MSEEKKSVAKKMTATKKEKIEPKNGSKSGGGRFKSGNVVGSESRFKPGNDFSCKYKDEYADMLIEYFSEPEREIIYEELYAPDGSLKGKKPVQTLPPRLPTFEGFANKIGVVTQTLVNWCSHPRFGVAYARAKELQKDIIMTNAIQRQYDGNFSKFLLINNHGMTEQIKTDTTFKVVMDDGIDEEGW